MTDLFYPSGLCGALLDLRKLKVQFWLHNTFSIGKQALSLYLSHFEILGVDYTIILHWATNLTIVILKVASRDDSFALGLLIFQRLQIMHRIASAIHFRSIQLLSE